MTADGTVLQNWEIFPLPMNNTNLIPWQIVKSKASSPRNIPTFYHGEFSSHQANDTFLQTSEFIKVSFLSFIFLITINEYPRITWVFKLSQIFQSFLKHPCWNSRRWMLWCFLCDGDHNYHNRHHQHNHHNLLLND